MDLAESVKFRSKLYNFLNLNHALKLAGYSNKFICEMDEKEYSDYILTLEYLNVLGVIDLQAALGKGH